MTVKSSETGDEKPKRGRKKAAEEVPFDEGIKTEIIEQPEGAAEEEPQNITPGLAAQLKELQSKIARLEADRVGRDKLSEPEMLSDDYMDEPRVYHCFSSYYAIWGDTRLGKYLPTPYDKPIRFHKLYRFTKADKTGRGVQTVNVSQAVTHSKKEAQYIESHSLYGIKFSREMKGTQDEDVLLAEKMVEVAGMVRGMDDMAVIGRAKAEGINIQTADVGMIRRKLIKKLAIDTMQKESAAKQRKIREMALQAKPIKVGEEAARTGVVEDVYH